MAHSRYNKVTFGRITQQVSRVLIVATGPSAAGFQLKRAQLPGVHIMAVKAALLNVEAHSWITVDPNDRARPMMANQRSGVRYMAAVPDDYGTESPRVFYHRGPAEKNVLYLRRIAGTGELKSKDGLSEDPGSIHTGNSAWGALGAAYLMNPEKIGIIGLDANQRAHGIGTGLPRGSLAHLPRLFATAIPQLEERKIEVRNASPNSRVTCFKKCSIKEVLQWLVE